MAMHRIVCVYWLVAMAPSRHSHAIAIGTLGGNTPGSRPAKTWSVDKAVEAVAAGEQFAVGAPGQLRMIEVLPRSCKVCGMDILASEPSEGFDGLPECLIG